MRVPDTSITTDTAAEPSVAPSFSTPMMQQYLALKREYADCILLFRLGDFYEMFLDDAELGARVLGITLTSRTRGKDGRIPMAGVPYHAIEGYLAKLLAAGHKVAICDQVTPPKSGELVRREVTRVLTPGTVVSEYALSQLESTWVAIYYAQSSSQVLALMDVASGQICANIFKLNDTQLIDLLNKLIVQYNIAEWLLSPDSEKSPTLITSWLERHPSITITQPDTWFTTKQAAQTALRHTLTAAQLHHDIFKDSLTSQAIASLLSYATYTQKTLPQHTYLTTLFAENYLQLDQASISHLELLPSHASDNTPTLFSTLNHTYTAHGTRMLRQWLLRPLQDPQAISERLDSVAFLVEHPQLLAELPIHLQRVLDIERIVGRLTLQLGTPRDLIALATSLTAVEDTFHLLHQTQTAPLLVQLAQFPEPLRSVATLCSSTIVAEPPLDPRQGHLILPGINPQLDRLRQIATERRQFVAELEQSLRTSTNITSLKVRYNQVFGFYIEVSKANVAHVPEHFIRKQTLVNAERFTVPELTAAEHEILHAEEEAARIEFEIFQQVVRDVLAHTPALQQLAEAVATVDVLRSFAQVANEYSYTRPTITPATTESELKLTASRHPVLERLHTSTRFVPNDICLDHQSQQLLILTGPNMAGKSVLMRQVALITLMAHMGSFVPAKSATIPLTDRIFVRSGAGDAMTQGLSTFMVEMVETASILREATERSLVIMDEIGRGTSTHDGISLAWAVAEYLTTQISPGPLTLFATHYHELQELADTHPDKIANYHLAITEHDGKLIFLYSLEPGGASQSHGLKVAELAGVPAWVVEKAGLKLSELSSGVAPQPATTKNAEKPSPVLQKLKKLDPNELTPRQALDKLYELKKLLITDELD